VDGLYFPVFRYTAAVDFIHQPVQTCSTEHLNAEILVPVVKAKSRLLTLGGATLCYNFDEFRVISCVQNKTALRCASKLCISLQTGSGELENVSRPHLKPNSITLASSELAPNMFGASSELVRSQLA